METDTSASASIPAPAPASTPKPSAPSDATPSAKTTPASKSHNMPAVDDRVAADLRSRASGPNWTSDVRVCHALREWQMSSDLSPGEAASRLGLPHVTGDTFARLRACQKPTGLGGHWAELMGLVIECKAEQRAQARFAALQAPDAVATAPKASTPATTSTSAPRAAVSKPPKMTDADLRALMVAVEGELGRGVPKTVALARRVRTAIECFPPIRPRQVSEAPGCGGLAAAIAHLLEPKRKGPPTASEAYQTWHARLRIYVTLTRDTTPTVIAKPHRSAAVVVEAAALDASEALQTAATASGPLRGTATATTSRIIGRPKLQSDGRLRIEIAATMDVGVGDALWADALALVNAA